MTREELMKLSKKELKYSNNWEKSRYITKCLYILLIPAV